MNSSSAFFLLGLIGSLLLFASTSVNALSRPRHSDLLNAVDVFAESTSKTRFKRSAEDVKKDSEDTDLFKVSDLSSAFHLNNSHLHLMVHWAGQGSNLMFCLARDQTLDVNATSKVFISRDYGTMFEDISSKFVLDNGKLALINKFHNHPNQACHYVFTDVTHRYIFVSDDCGDNFTTRSLELTPDEIVFDSNEASTFLVHDVTDLERKLYVTHDFGRTFSHVQDYVESFFFTDDKRLFVQRLQPSNDNQKRRSAILMSEKFFERQMDTHVIFNGAEELEVRNDVVFVTRRSNAKDNHLELHISLDGQKFVMATFGDGELIHRDFYIVDVTDDHQVMLAINHDAVLSNLYVSTRLNEHEAEFVLSLERVLYYNPNVTFKHSWLTDMSRNEPFVDVHKVAGLRGIYIANQINKDASNVTVIPSDLSSVISFDMGALWRRVEGPLTDDQGHPYDGCKDTSKKCSLHLSQQLSRKYPMQRAVPILSSKSAVGIILGSGNVGDTLQGKNNVFLSADAGLSWHQVLKGAHLYNIGDHGGVIVAVKYFKTQGWTNELMYSIDEGRNWDRIIFYKEPLRIYGLLTEPGENTTIFTLFGSTDTARGVDWIIVKVDLRSVFDRNCTMDDYRQWSPSDSESVNKHRGCILGRKEIFERRVVNAKCYNGRDYERVVSLANCLCEREDYMCDFAFIKDEADRCVKDALFDHDPYEPPYDCREGKFFERTRGYVKIPGDTCQGGKASWFEPQTTACPVSVEREFMLVSQRHSIVRIDLANSDEDPEELPVGNVNNVITLEFDTIRNCLIYGDIELDQIFVQCLNGTERRVIVDSDLRSVEGMSYDWTSQSLFFVDGAKPSIEVVSLKGINNEHSGMGKLRKTILSERYVKKPRGLAVHPMEGYLFFSDWSDHNPHIGRCNMDGSEVTKVVTKPHVVWPNGITIDFASNRLFWVDAQKDFIASSDLDGKAFKKILSQNPSLTHPFAIAVHKELMYWDDWNKKAIFYADKNTGQGLKLLQANLNGAMDLKIYSNIHRSGTSACDQDDSPCSHLCLPMPKPTNYVCLCPDGMKLTNSTDGRSNDCTCPDGTRPSDRGTCPAKADGSCYDSQYKCNNSECVPLGWRCDGGNDCSDNSDEFDCKPAQCEEHQFTCGNGKCIPGYWKCDFDDDCGDNSDEEQCDKSDCDSEHFRCNNGQCISLKWRCDLEKDCQDGSDEMNCTAATDECGEKQFRCSGYGQCLPDNWKCDGDNDCPNGEDEADCASVSCKTWQYQCGDGQCIFKTWLCDGQNDCRDGSDEQNCTTIHHNTSPETPELPETVFPKGECHDWMFKCKNEQCIPFWWKCDGTPDCSDNSDELECERDTTPATDVNVNNSRIIPTPSPKCGINKFACDDGECIWQSWVCDNEQDCSGGEDEDADLCRFKHNCSQNEFRCEFSTQCIDYKQVCDGISQCGDGSDEHGCDDINGGHDSIDCGSNHFLCDQNKCRPNSDWCDGKRDCNDNTDEFSCDHGDENVVRSIDVVELTDTVVKIRWYTFVHRLPEKNELEFRPKLTIEDSGDLWVKSKEWLEASNNSYRFDGLHPYTRYNLTVDYKIGERVIQGTKFITVRTAEGVPGAPTILAVELFSAKKVQISWTNTGRPNGKIVGYEIEMNPGSRIFTVDDPDISNTIINFDYQRDTEYVFRLRAINPFFKGEFSQPAKLTSSPSIFSASVTHIGLSDVKDTSAKLQFHRKEPSDAVDGFLIHYNSDNRFATYAPIEVPNKASVDQPLTGLSPNTSYWVSVFPVDKNGLKGEKSVAHFHTTGSSWPTPMITKADVSADNANAIELTWKLMNDAGKQDFTFGIFYGVSMVDLLQNGIRFTAKKKEADEFTSTVVRNLDSCQSYIFVVMVVTPGFGPPSKPVSVSTNYAPGAPPKNLAASLVSDNTLHITWEASCIDMDSSIGYVITMKDLINSKVSDDVTYLAATQKYYLSQDKQVPYGSRYEVQVKTDDPKSQGASIIVDGPPLPKPVHVTHHWLDIEEKRTQFVHWQWSDDLPIPHSEAVFLVHFSRHNNMSEPKTFEVQERPIFAISDAQLPRGEKYFVSVQLRDKRGYVSAMSNPILVEISDTSLESQALKEGSNFFVMPILLLFLVAGCIVCGVVYVRRNQRFSRRFKEFRSRYSPAAGSAAILNQNDFDEDEDDAPIIRGFSDHEPLVVA